MQFLCVLLGGVAVLIFVYQRLSRFIKSAVKDAENSRKIIKLTNTNNNYDPLGDVLTSLDDDLEELSLSLDADMKGYMDGK